MNKIENHKPKGNNLPMKDKLDFMETISIKYGYWNMLADVIELKEKRNG